MIDVEGLRKAAEAATKGPWALTESDKWPFRLHIDAGEKEVLHMHRHAHTSRDRCLDDALTARNFPVQEREAIAQANREQSATAAFIAAANPATVLALLDRLRVAEAESARLQRVIDGRPALNMSLIDNYIWWRQDIATMEFVLTTRPEARRDGR